MDQVGSTLSSAARVMAILNATPDSFYDGGRWADSEALHQHVDQCLALGVAWLDIGGESTRPGSAPVQAEEEWQRVRSMMQSLRSKHADAPISVDTRKAEVAAKAVALGAGMINDVSGLADPEMAGVAASFGVELVIGHLRGDPQSMQSNIHFEDVVQEVSCELSASVERAIKAGVARDKIWVDPGIGFGKNTQQCLSLLGAGAAIARNTGARVLIGASRKRFLGEVTGQDAQDRQSASVAAALLAIQAGASMVRVHDVQATCDGLAVLAALAAQSPATPGGLCPK